MIRLQKFRYWLAQTITISVLTLLPLALWATGTNSTDSGALVPCGAGSNAGPDSCRWQDLVELFHRIVNFIFTDVMIPLAVIAIVYAGIKILISRDKPAKLNEAYGTLKNVGIGIFLALGAYAIVKSILTLLPTNPSGPLNNVINIVFGS